MQHISICKWNVMEIENRKTIDETLFCTEKKRRSHSVISLFRWLFFLWRTKKTSNKWNEMIVEQERKRTRFSLSLSFRNENETHVCDVTERKRRFGPEDGLKSTQNVERTGKLTSAFFFSMDTLSMGSHLFHLVCQLFLTGWIEEME